MALTIPSRYLSKINQIRNLSDASVGELVNAITSSDVRSSAKGMLEQITPLVPGVTVDQLRDVVDGLYALYRVREYSDLNRNSFLKELMESVRLNADPAIPDDEMASIADRFKRLLKIETLESISKAASLQRDHERVYCDARIITDIRPVFGRDDDSAIKAAVITHTLKISYHEDGEHRDIYFSLDEHDLYELRSVLDRADAKAATTDKFLTGKLPRLGI